MLSVRGKKKKKGKSVIIRLPSLPIGVNLLGGFFLYDVFWVYGSSVMVTVGRAIKGPLLFRFPRFNENQEVMLGLGDAVIPAIYLNYILHFLLCGTRKPTSMYFITGMVAYFCSLICATCAALYFRSGQPALFFIVGLITSGPVGDLAAVIHRSTRSWALLGAP